MKIKKIEYFDRNGEDVFNLEVQNNHNYFVNDILVSNCHGIKALNKINKLLQQIPARMRFGFTGTLPDNKIDQWNICGALGPVIYSKSSSDLRDQKMISQVTVALLKINYTNVPKFTPASMDSPTLAYEEEITFLQTNKFRNKTIAKLVERMDKNVLVMVDRIAHGEVLFDILRKQTTKRVYFISGAMEVTEREKIRDIMEKNDDVVCIAIAKIFSTGINIKRLNNVLFAAIGKAKIKIIQSIGRSLRLHSGKPKAYIFDLADQLKYGQKHLKERLSIYKKEQISISTTDIRES